MLSDPKRPHLLKEYTYYDCNYDNNYVLLFALHFYNVGLLARDKKLLEIMEDMLNRQTILGGTNDSDEVEQPELEPRTKPKHSRSRKKRNS